MDANIGMSEVLERAKQQLSQVTGLEPITATRMSKDEVGWRVGLEMLEMSRIPSSTDVLGRYDVLVDSHGSMVSFERRGTRLRGEVVREDESLAGGGVRT